MKIIYALCLIGTLLTATEFTNRERGNITGVGFVAAQKININNKEAKNSNAEIQKKLCAEEIKTNKIILSFKENKEEATIKAIEECMRNLQRLKEAK